MSRSYQTIVTDNISLHIREAKYSMACLINDLIDTAKLPISMKNHRDDYPRIELSADCTQVTGITVFTLVDSTPDLRVTVMLDSKYPANSVANVSLVYDDKIVRINHELQILESKVSKSAVQANIRTLLKNAGNIIK